MQRRWCYLSLLCAVALAACGAPQTLAPTAPSALSATPLATPAPVVPSRTAAPTDTPTPIQSHETPASTGAGTIVQGSVQIEDGREVVGGTAGDLIPIDVAFAASSTAGPVTEMRVGNICAADRDLSARPWEPFAATKTYSTTAAINFVGWYVSVQYRDTQGNLSPIYCDDISVEGMPAPPPTLAP